jgi:NAD(P)-dependent dehydrogenase (short-subunit alcohol dehydrogenase family)
MIRAGRGGHLVNVSSAAGLFGLPWHAAYSASKFGLRGISEVLRFDLERHGIGVSLVCPGAVDTPLTRTVQILGIDLETPAAKRFRERFRKHAVTPEVAARAIVRGILRNEYLVFTSQDIRVGHWFQQRFGFLYEQAMRRMNDQLHRVAHARRRSSDPSVPAVRLAEERA